MSDTDNRSSANAVSRHSEMVSDFMFNFLEYDLETIRGKAANLPPKLMRWIATNHPDNRIRKEFFRMSNVVIGDDAVLNAGIVISDNFAGLVSIGARASLASNIVIIASADPNRSNLAELPYVSDRLIREAPVVIGDDAWIGAGAIILPGVSVGNCSVIGAGAVLSRSTEPWGIYAGVPARLIRKVPGAATKKDAGP